MATERKGQPLKKQTDTIPLKMMKVGKWMDIRWTKKGINGREKIYGKKGNIAVTYTITQRYAQG